MPNIIEGAKPDLVAELEAQFGDRLTQARADYQENQAEQQRLDKRRAELVEKKKIAEATRTKRLIEHGRGIKGAAEKRASAEKDLDTINGEIEAVDAAIYYEVERSGTLKAELSEMETKLGEAKRRQVQNEIAEALRQKKEEFIYTLVESCKLLGEMVKLSNELIAVEGHSLFDQTLEDLLLRTSRTMLIDRDKFTEAQSGLGLARRVFEVTALVPPPEPPPAE